MADGKPDYKGLLRELSAAGIDEVMRGKGGTIIVSNEYYEGIDDKKGSCVINPWLERKAFPGKFGFNIEEGDTNGENFVVLVPPRAS